MNYQLLAFFKGLVLFLCSMLILSNVQAQHISDFNSIPNAPRSGDFKIPSTHDFQYLTHEDQNGALANFDFTAFVPTNGSSSNGHLSINHEITNGGVSVYDISQNQNTKAWTLSNKINIRYGQVQRPCSGLVTSWGAVLACEEVNEGRVLEINPVNGQSIFRHQLGRLAHENVAEHRTNQRTFYTGEDTGASNDVLLKFVADSPADLSSGSLYALQVNGSTGTWLPIPNTSTTDTDNVALAAGASGFAGIEDVEIHPITGQVYFSVKNEGRVYRFTEGNDLGAGGVSNFQVYAQTSNSYNINGADNMAFDNLGNLYVLQDASNTNYNIYLFDNNHTLQNPQVKIFGRASSNAEPTGITFTPDFKYMFLSIQDPSNNNSAGQPDFFGGTVPNDKSFAVVIARNETWAGQNCSAGTPINLNQYDFLVCNDTNINGLELSGITYNPTRDKFYSVGDEGTLVEFGDDGVTRSISLESVGNNTCPFQNGIFNDTEGITHVSGDQFAIIEEREARIGFVTITPNTTNVNFPDNQFVQLQINGSAPACSNATGLEGIAYNGDANQMYTVRQSSPATVYSFDVPNGNNGTAQMTAIANLTNIASGITIQSAHGIHFDITNKNILVLATIADGSASDDGDNQRVIIEITPCGDYVSHIELEDQNYFSANQPNNVEGITMKNGDIILIGEGPTSSSPSKRFCLSKNQAVVCNAPASSSESNLSASSVRLNWGAVSGASSYQVDFKKNSDPSWTTSTLATTATNRTISLLSASTNYQWRVKTNCPNGVSSTFRTDSFQTPVGPCPIPPSSSESNITSSSVQLNWGAVAQASSYRIEYKKTSDPSWILETAATTATSRTIDNLSASTNYQWKVLTECSNGTNSTYRTDTFTTSGNACAPPTNPTTTFIGEINARFNWTPSANATSYRVEYKKVSESTWTVRAAGTSGVSVATSGLDPSTQYQWKVRSNCGGATSSFVTAAFTTAAPSSCATTSSTFSSCEGFESGLGIFTQATDDDINWTRKSGGTSSSNTGPTSADEGSWYMYIETSGSNSPSKDAKLQTSCITIDQPSLSFKYHMYGSTMGTLRVNLINNSTNQSTTIFTKSGDQGNNWLSANIDLASYQGQDVILEFFGTTGSSFRSDIAIDNICFGGPVCDPPSALNETSITSTTATLRWTGSSTATSYRVEYKRSNSGTWIVRAGGTSGTQVGLTGLTPNSTYNWRVRSTCSGDTSPWVTKNFNTQPDNQTCSTVSTEFGQCKSFESGLDNFVQKTNDDINWTRKTGGTSSSATGPSGAYNGSQYMYVESSSPNFPNKIARLEYPCFKLDDPNRTTLNFHYHMYGSSMGTLEVKVKFGGASASVFNVSGDQGNTWKEANIDLSAFINQDITIEFIGYTGSSFRSDMAIDNICFTGGGCVANPNTINLPSFGSSEFFINTTVGQAAGVTGHDNGNVFVITDNAQRIIQYNPAGTVVGQSTLSGFSDTEAIAYMGNNEFAIVEEVRSRVSFVTISATNMPSTISYPATNRRMTINVGGMEGIAYDRASTKMYVSKQNSKQIYEFTLGNTRTGAITPSAIDVSSISSPLVHGLEFLPNGNLLVLGSNATITSANKTLFEIDLCGNQISKKDLNSLPQTPGGVNVSAGKMDGIAIGTDGCIYGAIDLSPGKLYKLCTQSSGGGITDCSRNSGIETSCSYNESFDSGFGLWVNKTGDDLNWLRRSNSTSSANTGPSAPSNGSQYTYIESSSSGVGYPNKAAILESPCFKIPSAGSTSAFMSFDYHMYGSTMGTLYFEITTDDVNWTSVWTRSGDQGNQWRNQNINISSYSGQTIRARFRAVTGTLFRSDFAIDNFQSGCNATLIQVETRETPAGVVATDLKVFPNPVQEYLTIEYQSALSDQLDIQIINPMGQVIRKETHSKVGVKFQQEFNVSDLANGIYHVRIKEGDQMRSARFVVTK